MGRRWRTLTTLVVFVPAALVLGSTSALAECTGSIFFPPFRQAIVTADSVVIGTVVKNYNEDRGQPGLTSHFKVQVDETLRGPSRSSVEIDDLRALKGGCVANLVVRVGWQIAIASDASVPGVPGRLTAVAYLNHDPRSFRKMAFPVRSDAGFSCGTNTSWPAVRNRVANCTLNSRSGVVNKGPAR